MPVLRPLREAGRVTLVLGAMADKDVDGIIAALAREPSLATARVVATAVDAPRALPAADLAERWRALVPDAAVEASFTPDAALQRALRGAGGAGPAGPVVVAGSLYLVGEVRSRLVDDPALRDG